MDYDLSDDLILMTLNRRTILGADEAGRGPLAGPVYAAAVVLPPDFPIQYLDDSKKLNQKQLLFCEELIKAKATAWAVAFATHEEIDRINILNAAMLAMKRAIHKIDACLFDSSLIDGNRVPDIRIPSLTLMPVVKGDSKIPQIAAASILAKTARDRFMLFCDKKYPQYGYSQHKGYPTKAHIQAIREYGPSPIQRLSFSY